MTEWATGKSDNFFVDHQNVAQNQICVRAALNTSKHPNVNAIEVEVEVACVENVKNGNRMELINCGGCACLTLGTFNLNICYFWTVGLHQRAFDVC